MKNKRVEEKISSDESLRGRKGWIRIVEATTAILLIAGVALLVLNTGYIEKNNISSEIYDAEAGILRGIGINDSLREDILNVGTLPVNYSDAGFPVSVKNKINQEAPYYLKCEAKICELNDSCLLDRVMNMDVYASSTTIFSNLKTYAPRQLKLFCWDKIAEGPCVPDCSGKVCGSDGCFGSCYGIAEGEDSPCNASFGTCIGTGIKICSENIFGNCNITSEDVKIMYCEDEGRECGTSPICDESCGNCTTLYGDGYVCESGSCVVECIPNCSGIIDTFTKLLLHMDNTGLTDETGKTVTLNDGVSRSATQYKFPVVGGYSAYFDGAGDYLSIADNEDWYFGTEPFTIDFWVYFNTLPTDVGATFQGPYGQWVDNSNWILCQLGGFASGNQLFMDFNTFISGVPTSVFISGINWHDGGAAIWETNTWYHIAIIRGWGGNANDWQVTRDGQGAFSSGHNGNPITNSMTMPNMAASAWVGRTSGAGVHRYMNGYIDEFRVSKGIARWTSDFSSNLPTAPYPLDKQCGSDGCEGSCGSCGNCIQNYCY